MTEQRTAAGRKARSIQILRAEGVPTIDHLPETLGDAEATPRTPQQVRDRIRGLAAVGAWAELADTNTPHAEFIAEHEAWGNEAFLTPEERAFVHNPSPTPRDINENAWVIEAIYALQWALGWWAELCPPGAECDNNAVIEQVFRRPTQQTGGLRSKCEILDAFDYYYRCHWAVRPRDGQAPVPSLSWDVVVERRRALQWVCEPDTEWDDLSLDT